eukprot:TRINITY_DN5664_c0_g1_i2.p1 TRINITY_DN5664_c0_g1~~TRINITY_DN5664_c0_g1_i2.p1  ORF type:complete len:203 (+),score=58.04 TRINITY_DN5664_c0_g1_i2:61-669(+)
MVQFCMGALFFFFFKQKTAYEMLRSLVGSEMCIRDSITPGKPESATEAARAYAYSIGLSYQEVDAMIRNVCLPCDLISQKDALVALEETYERQRKLQQQVRELEAEVFALRQQHAGGSVQQHEEHGTAPEWPDAPLPTLAPIDNLRETLELPERISMLIQEEMLVAPLPAPPTTTPPPSPDSQSARVRHGSFAEWRKAEEES